MSTSAMRQLTKLQARADFRFKQAGDKGRAVTALAGSRWWITSSSTAQESTGLVSIAREGRGSIGTGYPFTVEQIEQLFDKC